MIVEAKCLFSSLELGADGISRFGTTSHFQDIQFLLSLISSFILSSLNPPKLPPSPLPFTSCIPMRSPPTTWVLVPAWFFHSNVRALALLYSPGAKFKRHPSVGNRSLTLKTRGSPQTLPINGPVSHSTAPALHQCQNDSPVSYSLFTSSYTLLAFPSGIHHTRSETSPTPSDTA